MFPRRPVQFAAAALLTALLGVGCGSAATTTASTASAPGATSRTTGAATTTSSTTSTPTAPASGTTSPTTTASSDSTAALPGSGKPPITVGDKNYTEQFVLGQLYVQALRAQGYTVNLSQNIGPTAVTQQALKTGTLSVYPEYLDVFNQSVAGDAHQFHTELAAYLAGQRYAAGHGLTLLTPTPFSDTSAVAVTDAYAAANRLRSIDDLRRVAPGMTFGGPPQSQQTAPILPQLAVGYGVTPAAVKPLAVGDQYTALNDSTIQAAEVNTTDGQLASGDYVLLRDPQRIFGWGNVVPVVSSVALIAEGPAFADTIERVDAALSTGAMRELNQAVDIAGQDPAAVAKQFLQTHGLLTPSAP